MSQEKISVTVKYVGAKDFQHDFESAATIHEVKLKAMHGFDLEESAAKKYALQRDGVDQVETTHLSAFHSSTLVFTLVLIEEVNKGHE